MPKARRRPACSTISHPPTPPPARSSLYLGLCLDTGHRGSFWAEKMTMGRFSVEDILFVIRYPEVNRNYPWSRQPTCICWGGWGGGFSRHNPQPSLPIMVVFWSNFTTTGLFFTLDFHAIYLLPRPQPTMHSPSSSSQGTMVGLHTTHSTKSHWAHTGRQALSYLGALWWITVTCICPQQGGWPTVPVCPELSAFLRLSALGFKTGVVPGRLGRVGHSIMSLAYAIFYGSLSA